MPSTFSDISSTFLLGRGAREVCPGAGEGDEPDRRTNREGPNNTRQKASVSCGHGRDERSILITRAARSDLTLLSVRREEREEGGKSAGRPDKIEPERMESFASKQTNLYTLSLTLLAIRSLLCLSVLPHRNSKKYSRAPPAIIRRTAWMVK